MPTTLSDRDTAIRRGRTKKRYNALTAMLCGVLPALLLSIYFPVSWQRWLGGVSIGVIWANGFEYVYHRWLLHRPRNPLGSGHLRHHAGIGMDDEAEHILLASSPLNVFLLYAVNSIPAFLLAFVTGLYGLLSGLFIGWMLYLIIAEEIHWRIHMNGWLPSGIRFARAYHLSHHDVPNYRFNIFLPLCDVLMGNVRREKAKLLT